MATSKLTKKQTREDTKFVSKRVANVTSATESTIQPTDVKAVNQGLNFASTMEIFNMQNFEIPFAIREVAEQSLEQARETYDKVKSATETATSALGDSIESSRKHVVKINEKVLDVAKANTNATFDHFKGVTAVKTAGEAFELQTAFTQKQFEVANKQGKELQDLASKFVTEIVAPAKEAFNKTFGTAQVN